MFFAVFKTHCFYNPPQFTLHQFINHIHHYIHYYNPHPSTFKFKNLTPLPYTTHLTQRR
ncbi:IS3 family transposase [Neisseria sicca]|uniref:IS3 family transposase n=1 Tax=Neisseria sicca TaxID=490 RepID=UPI0034D956AA